MSLRERVARLKEYPEWLAYFGIPFLLYAVDLAVRITATRGAYGWSHATGASCDLCLVIVSSQTSLAVDRINKRKGAPRTAGDTLYDIFFGLLYFVLWLLAVLSSSSPAAGFSQAIFPMILGFLSAALVFLSHAEQTTTPPGVSA